MPCRKLGFPCFDAAADLQQQPLATQFSWFGFGSGWQSKRAAVLGKSHCKPAGL